MVDPRAVDREAWGRFVDAHPRGTAFHRPEMLDVYSATRGDDPVFAAALHPNGSFAGVMVGVLQRSLPAPVGALTARAVFWGAPLVERDDPEVLRALLAGYEAAYGSRAVYTQFRHLWDASPMAGALRDAGYAYEDHLDVLVDLTAGTDALWKRLKHMRRKNVKKAEREGVEFREIDRDEDVLLAHEYVRRLYARIRLPLPPPSYFESLQCILRPAGLCRYFGAYHGGRLIAARLVLAHRDWLYDFWAGGDETAAELQGATVLPWAVMRWGAENGYRVFDFGGAGKPGIPYGVRDYKLAYGGELVSFGRHTRVHRPWIYRLGVLGVSLLRWRAAGRSGGQG